MKVPTSTFRKDQCTVLTAQDQDIRIVEVQCGEIISEEDIERLEDDYDRPQN
jgi:hypothetical protein